MMTFLAPFAWSALVLAVPVIALYLIKTRLRRRAVTTLLFWEQLRPPVYSHSLWRRLRRWLSLLLQIAFLTLLAFALARPRASWESAGSRATVLVLDPSPSMLATDVSPDRWTRALTQAQHKVSALRFSDQAALILADQPPRVLSGWTGSRRVLTRALDQIRDAPKHNPPEGIKDALTLARRLAAGRRDAGIVLWSDGAWNAPPDAALLAGVETIYLGTKDPVNTGILTFSARRSLAAPGDWIVAAEVQRFGGAAADAELEVTRNGQVLDVQGLRLTPGQPWRKTWTGHADDATKFAARLRASAPDQLAADDAAEANIAAVTPVNVDLVAPPNGFLDAALSALPSVRWHRRAANEPAPNPPAALSIFYRANPPTDFPANAAAILIDPPGGGFWGEPGGRIEHPLVSDYEKDSVPLRFVGLDSVSLQSAREFRPPPGAEVFAQSFGQPLAFGRWPAATTESDAARRWLVLPFDLENTDFVLRTAFPVLLGNLVQSLRIDQPAATHPLPGEVKSRLVRSTSSPANPPSALASAVTTPTGAWWVGAPLWWWATAAGLCWLLLEWWLFSRRVTE